MCGQLIIKMKRNVDLAELDETDTKHAKLEKPVPDRDCMMLIMSYLPARALHNLRLVCEDFNEIGYDYLVGNVTRDRIEAAILHDAEQYITDIWKFATKSDFKCLARSLVRWSLPFNPPFFNMVINKINSPALNDGITPKLSRSCSADDYAWEMVTCKRYDAVNHFIDQVSWSMDQIIMVVNDGHFKLGIKMYLTNKDRNPAEETRLFKALLSVDTHASNNTLFNLYRNQNLFKHDVETNFMKLIGRTLSIRSPATLDKIVGAARDQLTHTKIETLLEHISTAENALSNMDGLRECVAIFFEYGIFRDYNLVFHMSVKFQCESVLHLLLQKKEFDVGAALQFCKGDVLDYYFGRFYHGGGNVILSFLGHNEFVPPPQYIHDHVNRLELSTGDMNRDKLLSDLMLASPYYGELARKKLESCKEKKE